MGNGSGRGGGERERERPKIIAEGSMEEGEGQLIKLVDRGKKEESRWESLRQARYDRTSGRKEKP